MRIEVVGCGYTKRRILERNGAVRCVVDNNRRKQRIAAVFVGASRARIRFGKVNGLVIANGK